MHTYHIGDCLDVMRSMPDDSVDLVLCSPPYEAQRTYAELNFSLQGEEWVAWAVERYLECVRVSRGLVVWVVEGCTRNFAWSATPAMLLADLHRLGVRLRKPHIYKRQGIPGSGGPDGWRNDYEFCVCSSKGRLPWADPFATGTPSKYRPGGVLTHRDKNGKRKVQRVVKMQERTNPGNVISGVSGGGTIGHAIAHEGDAPYPEWLVTPYVRCFCPPGGIVLDPFAGTGTTACVARLYGRSSISVDMRESQRELWWRRIQDIAYEPATPLLGTLAVTGS